MAAILSRNQCVKAQTISIHVLAFDTAFDVLNCSKSKLYRKISNMSRTKSPNLTVYRLVLQLSLPSPMKLGVKSRIKM